MKNDKGKIYIPKEIRNKDGSLTLEYDKKRFIPLKEKGDGSNTGKKATR